MYKHHSYNNLIEKKLEQLPGPDAGNLWSDMEALLDRQMPQKKRYPGMLGWLCTNKAWMLAACLTLALTGLSVVYFTTRSSGSAPVSTATAPATAPMPEPAAAPTETALNAETSALTPAKPANHTIPAAVASSPAAAADRTQSTPATATAALDDPMATGVKQPVDNSAAPASSTQMNNQATVPGKTTSADAGNTDNAALSTITTTPVIALQEKRAPAVNAEEVARNKETLELLSHHIAAAKKTAHHPDEKGLYAGVVLGLDMSSVGFKSLQSGHNKGLIVGYAFNRFVSIESGLLWDKKRYYSAGANYKPDGYTPQPGLTIVDVNGVNQVYEWPISVKYNILARQHKLFATAGVSSYFMTREGYDLSYTWNGQQYNEYNSYRNESKHWLSIATFSLGYSHKVGRMGNVRVEPYLKLPLRDLGVGNMRVASTGLNVGFTKPLKR